MEELYHILNQSSIRKELQVMSSFSQEKQEK